MTVVEEAQLASASDAGVVEERLRRLAAHPDRHLSTVQEWSVRGSTARVVGGEAAAPTLEAVLAQGPLSPGEAAAVAWGVLSGLEALHRMSLAHGKLGPSSVRIGASGEVYLSGHWFQPSRRASPDELVADVEAAGAVGCAALGIAPHPAAGAPSAAEVEAPALARTLRAITAGASGGNVAGARMALAATAASLLEPEALQRAAERLARRARAAAPAGSSPPAAAPPPGAAAAGPGPVPPEPVDPPLAQPAPSRRYVASAADFAELREPFDWKPVSRIAIALGLLLIVVAAIWLIGVALSHRGPASPRPAANAGTPAASPAASARPTAAVTPTPAARPSPTPSFGPPSAGSVKSVQMTTSGPCAPGQACSADVVVTTTTATATTNVAWTVRAYDVCTGVTTDLVTDGVTEQVGWNHVESERGFTLPSAQGQLLLAAVTTAPAGAASSTVTVGRLGC